MSSGVEIRDLTGHAEYQACSDLQRTTWGADWNEGIPRSLLQVNQKMGGVSAGAFASDGTLVGFVFGMTGIYKGSLAHWSDLLAVLPSHRGQGLGARLKRYQRDKVVPLGVSTMYWTFDPLVGKNAYFNVEVLGARFDEYVADMYGEPTEGSIHRGLGMDRFIVAWDLEKEPDGTKATIGPEPIPQVAASSTDWPPRVSIQVPQDIEAIRDRSLEEAQQWRAETRELFQAAMVRGYRVIGILKDERFVRYIFEEAGQTGNHGA